jgi:hypothetical protein
MDIFGMLYNSPVCASCVFADQVILLVIEWTVLQQNWLAHLAWLNQQRQRNGKSVCGSDMLLLGFEP